MRKFHKYLGLILLIPFLGWAVTGVFFFIKPGYQAAYERLSVRSYPIVESMMINPRENWQETRSIKTILGLHLLVKIDNQWQHWDPVTNSTVEVASESDVKRLVTDAISSNLARYGKVVTVEKTDTNDFKITTEKAINIKFNWQQLSFRQSGPDTEFIDMIYKVHYLQWTGIEIIDRFLGVIGLAAVVILGLLGLKMSLRKRPVN